MSDARPGFDEWYVKSSYQAFVKQEGVPLYEGSALENLGTLELGDWERRGGKAAYTRLGEQETNSLQIVEIPPKGELKPEHHIYEAIMYVMQGRGASTIWQQGEKKHTVEWEEGALLSIPLNAWHQEFNSSGDEPCRLLFGTNAAHVINLYHNLDFVFNNSYSFTDRFTVSMPDCFTDEGRQWNLRLFETNFIPDIRSCSIGMHVMEASEGTYVTAHRHGAGAHVVVIGGEGYELLFMPGEEEQRRKVRTVPYAVVAPRTNEFHQHFNSGTGGYRMLAFRGTGLRYGSGRSFHPARTAQDTDPFAESFKIRYEREDPSIREDYHRELEKSGVTVRLEPLDQGRG